MIDQLPEERGSWGGRQIVGRIPYLIPGEAFINLATGALATRRNVLMTPPPGHVAIGALGVSTQSAYVHEEEYPFEIQDLSLDTTGVRTANSVALVADPISSMFCYIDEQNTLDASFQIVTCRDAGRGDNFLRQPARGALVFNPETGLWTLQAPYVVLPGKGVEIRINASGVAWVDDAAQTFDQLRVAITIRGELIVLGGSAS